MRSSPYSQTKEPGITIGEGKFIVTGGIMYGAQPQCSGKVTVTATLVSGTYTWGWRLDW